MENNSDNPGPSSNQPRRDRRDENWKEQIRLAIEESQRNIERQQAAQQAPGYQITVNAPRVTKSYYDRVRQENWLGRLSKHHQTKSDSGISGRHAKHGHGHGGTDEHGQFGGPNVASTSSNYSHWPRSHHHIAKHRMRRHDEHEEAFEPVEEEELGNVESQAPSTADSTTLDSSGDVLSYFDPNFVKPEFKEILGKSRNIVIGPPREILKKYFKFTNDDQIPDELRHDDTPKAFILPRKLWKEYDDSAAMAAEEAALTQSDRKVPQKAHEEDSFLLDKAIVRRMQEDKEIEPFVPRQPKNFAVDYIARKPFKKYGMISSNLNDASPGKMEHLELKDVNVDPGGQLRRDHTDRQFKISDVTETPVKIGVKEGPLRDDRRPWYTEGWAEGADPKMLDKSPRFMGKGKDDVYSPDTGMKSGSRGKGRGRGDSSDVSDPAGPGKDWSRRPRRKSDPRRRGSSLSQDGSPGSSGSSDGSGYSCTCGDSSSSSTSSSGAESSSSGSREGESSKKRKKHKRGTKDGEEEDEESAKPSKRDIAIDATNKSDETVPGWAPPQWKPPPGYKGWIYKDKKGSLSAPDTSVQFEEDPNSRVPGSEWFRAFGVVKKAEKEGDIERLRNILGVVEGEEDLLKLEQAAEEEEEGASEEEEEDPMERLPRMVPSSHQKYPEYPTPEHFKYYRSYPLYPTMSNERYFEWYKDVDRLANPFGRRRFRRPAGYSRSVGHIDWNDPKEAAKWYAYGYRRPDTRPKPERLDYNTKDYIYDNARSIMLMPSRKVIPKYIDDRKGTSHLLEPSGLVKKFIFRGDFGKVPDYLMGINEELGRPPYPDMDKFYRPHRCKYLHGHIHCKICMRAHPTVKAKKIDWHCEMTPRDYEHALEYRNSKKQLSQTNSRVHYSYNQKMGGASNDKEYDVESMLNEVGLGDEYRRSKAARGVQNLKTVQSSVISHPVNVILPPMYV